MAIVSLIPTKMKKMNEGYATPTAVAVGNGGMEIDYGGTDFKILVTVGVASATIKAGNGLQGVADLVVASGSSVVLESGAFKNIAGAHKGKVFISGAATATITAVELP